LIETAHPEITFDFINLGISGNRTDQLFDRLYPDAIALQPDVISILIGINDIWHRSKNVATTDEQFELNYRSILERIRKESNAKIMILAPFLLDKEPFEGMREDLERMLPIVRALAEEYADIFVPLDKHFEEALKTQPEPLYYSGDGVHPNDNGRRFIGKIYADAIAPIIETL
jgi:lysophospholipase L1-like esterase